MKILLHACCGPCSIYPTLRLEEQGKELSILYFNPNIHPYKEFKKRLNTLREFTQLKHYPLIVMKDYPLEECIKGMLSEPVVRCAFCYRIRLEETAKYAKENNYDAFTTTLLVSLHQKHELIKKIAYEMAEKYDIPFYYEDYRKGFEKGEKISKELEMYRQNYCGCIFSERDRFEPIGKSKLLIYKNKRKTKKVK